MTPQPGDRAQLIEDESLEFQVHLIVNDQAVCSVQIAGQSHRVQLPVNLLERISEN